jgi:hypothetical protein
MSDVPATAHHNTTHSPMATSFPIEVKSDRVILVRMTANKANVLTHAFFQQLHATLDIIQKQYPTMGVVFTGNGRCSFFYSALPGTLFSSWICVFL